MAKIPLDVLKDNLPKLLQALDTITKRSVYVGVPSDKDERQGPAGENNATLAYIHDHGAPAANVPARPFMRPGMKICQDRVSRVLGTAAKGAMGQESDSVEKGLHKAGLLAQNAIKKVINDGIDPPLAESTVAARKRRGRTGTKPLVDTGQLRNSISYVIRNK